MFAVYDHYIMFKAGLLKMCSYCCRSSEASERTRHFFSFIDLIHLSSRFRLSIQLQLLKTFLFRNVHKNFVHFWKFSSQYKSQTLEKQIKMKPWGDDVFLKNPSFFIRSSMCLITLRDYNNMIIRSLKPKSHISFDYKNCFSSFGQKTHPMFHVRVCKALF